MFPSVQPNRAGVQAQNLFLPDPGCVPNAFIFARGALPSLESRYLDILPPAPCFMGYILSLDIFPASLLYMISPAPKVAGTCSVLRQRAACESLQGHSRMVEVPSVHDGPCCQASFLWLTEVKRDSDHQLDFSSILWHTDMRNCASTHGRASSLSDMGTF